MAGFTAASQNFNNAVMEVSHKMAYQQKLLQDKAALELQIQAADVSWLFKCEQHHAFPNSIKPAAHSMHITA